MFGSLRVKERCSAVLEEEGGYSLPKTCHGLGSKVTDEEVGLSVYEGHQLSGEATVMFLEGEGLMSLSLSLSLSLSQTLTVHLRVRRMSNLSSLVRAELVRLW